MNHRILNFVGAIAGIALLCAATPRTPAPSPTSLAALPVLVIQEIETDSPSSYAMWISEVDQTIQKKLDVASYVRVFVGEIAGPDSCKVFAVTTCESFAKLAANSEVFEQELAMAKTRAGMSEVRKLGPATALKAVRWEGRNTASFAFNHRIVVRDEAAYLKALDGLRERMDANGFQDVKVNCSRVISGRTEYTHLVSMNAPSAGRRALLMDAIATEAWAQEWVASVANLRTVVTNGSFREITK